MEIPRSFVDGEKFIDVFDDLRLNSKIGVHFDVPRSEGKRRQQIKVSSTVYGVFTVESFCHLRTGIMRI